MPTEYGRRSGFRVMSIIAPVVRSPSSLVSLTILIVLVILGYVWQHTILAAQKGFYSPFQSGLSFYKYVCLLAILNCAMALLSFKRDKLWIYIPLVITGLLLLLTIFYMVAIIRYD